MIIGITAGAMLVAVIVIIAVLMASGSDSRKYSKHMESAQRYMDELQYEQAIAEYKAAIEIEPNNVGAYRALAELYVQMRDYEAAITVLNQGIEQTGAEELYGCIEMKYQADGSHWVWEYDMNGNYMITRYQVNGTIYLVEEYDANGNCAKVTWYNEDGTIKVSDEYGRDGILVKSAHYDDKGGVVYYEHDSDGNCVKATCYRADGFYLVVEYDGNGMQFTYYNSNGELSSYVIYEYDGNLGGLREVNYYDDGRVSWILKHNVNCLKETRYYYNNVDRTIDFFYVINEYDGSWNLVKSTDYSVDGSGTVNWYAINEYDGNGNLVKSTSYSVDGSGTVNWYAINEYDGNGNLVKSNYYNADGSEW